MMNPFNEELISAYIDGELSPDERREVEQALAESAEHRRLYEELASLHQRLRSLQRHSYERDSSDVVLRRAERAMLAPSEERQPELPAARTSDSAPVQATSQPDTVGPATKRVWRRAVIAAVAATAAVFLLVLVGPRWNDRSVVQTTAPSEADRSRDETAELPESEATQDAPAAAFFAESLDRVEEDSHERSRQAAEAPELAGRRGAVPDARPLDAEEQRRPAAALPPASPSADSLAADAAPARPGMDKKVDAEGKARRDVDEDRARALPQAAARPSGAAAVADAPASDPAADLASDFDSPVDLIVQLELTSDGRRRLDEVLNRQQLFEQPPGPFARQQERPRFSRATGARPDDETALARAAPQSLGFAATDAEEVEHVYVTATAEQIEQLAAALSRFESRSESVLNVETRGRDESVMRAAVRFQSSSRKRAVRDLDEAEPAPVAPLAAPRESATPRSVERKEQAAREVNRAAELEQLADEKARDTEQLAEPELAKQNAQALRPRSPRAGEPQADGLQRAVRMRAFGAAPAPDLRSAKAESASTGVAEETLRVLFVINRPGNADSSTGESVPSEPAPPDGQ